MIQREKITHFPFENTVAFKEGKNWSKAIVNLHVYRYVCLLSHNMSICKTEFRVNIYFSWKI